MKIKIKITVFIRLKTNKQLVRFEPVLLFKCFKKHYDMGNLFLSVTMDLIFAKRCIKALYLHIIYFFKYVCMM